MRRDDAMLILLRHASHTPLSTLLALPTLLRRQLAIYVRSLLRAIFHYYYYYYYFISLRFIYYYFTIIITTPTRAMAAAMTPQAASQRRHYYCHY
jgi:hypothetical protein